jgi:large subunit ribosomal protein L22
MIQAHATARYVRTSAQKAGLVLNLIRGKDVTTALATLKFSGKAVARDVAKVLESAIANARQKDGFGGEVERLFVSSCYANQGPTQKRIRPAPMGRAFRVLKRTTHLTVAVTEKAEAVVASAPSAARRARVARSRGEDVEMPTTVGKPAAAPRARTRTAAPKGAPTGEEAATSAARRLAGGKPAKKGEKREKGGE